ncbi:MAG: preprotein translocase subunit SecY [Vampirovibrionales bacterium]|nr:preprotein translocase subunit SecY [Vampirovibrionales bacterium]
MANNTTQLPPRMLGPQAGLANGKQNRMPSLAELKGLWQASGLREKLLFTLVALAVYRLCVQVPIWGVNPVALKQMAGSQLLGFLDMFSGGALTSLSVISLGIGPYITASIIIQLLTAAIPKLEEIQKEEGEAGRRKIAQITRYASVGLATLQSILVIKLFASNPQLLLPGVSPMLFYPLAVISLVAGSMFALWLSEMITDRGLGNGGSLIIFVGIIAGIPFYASQTATLVGGDPKRALGLVVLLAIFAITIGLIIILQEAVRKVSIISAKRQVGRNVYGGQQSHIPFKLNPSGVMPIIFSFAILALPQTLVQLYQQTRPTGLGFELIRFYSAWLAPGSVGYIILQFTLIVFFTFFYASIVPSLQPREIAEQLRKYGSSIPGVKPGRPTAEKLQALFSKILFMGAVGLGSITLIANSATSLTGITTLSGLGASGLIIMVGVALDTVNQVKVHLLAKQYEGFLAKTR